MINLDNFSIQTEGNDWLVYLPVSPVYLQVHVLTPPLHSLQMCGVINGEGDTAQAGKLVMQTTNFQAPVPTTAFTAVGQAHSCVLGRGFDE